MAETINYKIIIDNQWSCVTESTLNYVLNCAYGLGWKKLTIFGSNELLHGITHWYDDSSRIHSKKSKKYPGFFYWHYVSDLGVNCRLVFDESLGNNIELKEGHLEVDAVEVPDDK